MQIQVFDGHNDSLRHLAPYTPEKAETYIHGTTSGHFDLRRAREGGFAGGFFAVYVPTDRSGEAPPDPEPLVTPEGYDVPLPAALEPAYAARVAMKRAAGLFRLEAAAPDQIRIVRTHVDLSDCLERGILAAILHFEGAEAIDPDLDALEVVYAAGLRSLGIVWSRPNLFGHGVPFRFPHSPDTGPGLTEAGCELVRACNRLGVLIDVSHLNEAGFWDVARLSGAPLVATHSAAHALCPMTRNLTDQQLDAIRESDGMVGVNFEVSATRPDGRLDPDTPLEVLARHVDYLVERLGIDRVGFGSDFDGATMPLELGDVAGLPRLVEALRSHGYDDESLGKLCYRNWLRVIGKTWK